MKYKSTIWLLTFLAVIFSLTATASAGTVVDIINDSEDHTILETALNNTGLMAPLSAEDVNFTVFAPTDAAFDALPSGLLESLSEEELTNILLYHVLDGRVNSTDLSDGMTATTLQGKDVLITINGTDVFINNAQVTVVDIQADNGVVHVIDAVLIPPNIKADIMALISQVGFEDLNLPIDRALDAKLDAALKSVSRGNKNAAANQLNAFINHVEAQSGKAIDEEAADEWIDIAGNIVEDLESNENTAANQAKNMNAAANKDKNENAADNKDKNKNAAANNRKK